MTTLKITIIAELLRVYILGLFAMLLFSLFGGVSWAAIAVATSWLQVSFLPLILGAWTSLAIDLGRLMHRATKKVLSWI